MSLRIVVLDTNVLVSAGLRADGLEAKILERVLEDELILITCPEIVDEYREVLGRPTSGILHRHLAPVAGQALQRVLAWFLAGAEQQEPRWRRIPHRPNP